MLSWFKKYLVPHKENDFKPHALRIRATIIILSVVLVIQILFLLQSFFILPNTNLLATVFSSVVIDLVNEERALRSSQTLKTSELLQKAAQQKANDMAQRGYFDHIDPDGKYPWYWFNEIGYSYEYAGENIAIHFFDSKDLLNAWMNSSAHRENILNNSFTEIGIGISQGLYKGKKTTFIVQFFGTPLAINTIQAPIQKTEVIDEDTDKTPATETITTTQAVQGISEEKPSIFNRIISSPRTATINIYATLFTIISLVLLLNVFLHIKIQRSEVIIDGVIILIFIGSVLLLNASITRFFPVGL